MSWSVKPYLGSEPIVLISAYDEAIDWECTEEETGVTIGDYVSTPWKHQEDLRFLKGDDAPVPIKIYMRAPTPFDLRDTEVRKASLDTSGGNQTIEIDAGNEAFSLFRRCLEDVRTYYPNGGAALVVGKCKGPGGIDWADSATMNVIPYEVITEMGKYLRLSQQIGGDLKKD